MYYWITFGSGSSCCLNKYLLWRSTGVVVFCCFIINFVSEFIRKELHAIRILQWKSGNNEIFTGEAIGLLNFLFFYFLYLLLIYYLVNLACGERGSREVTVMFMWLRYTYRCHFFLFKWFSLNCFLLKFYSRYLAKSN